jgi:hypothetical protein
MNTSLLKTAQPFDSWARKAEEMLCQMFPENIESGRFHTVHVGRNNDSANREAAGFKVRGNARNEAIYLETPDRNFPLSALIDADARVQTLERRVDSSVAAVANERLQKLLDQGVELKEAQRRVSDSITKAGYFDKKSGKYVIEPMIRNVNDSVLANIAAIPWNISTINKVYKKPYFSGYADRLVSKIGAPNIWADHVRIFTASYEGAARMSNVARGTQEFNTSIAAKRKVGTMMTDIVNLVIDYETQSPNELLVGSQEGNWLPGATFGDMDRFADLMLNVLWHSLVYFGDTESGFEGLLQIANRDGTVDQYDGITADYIWQHDGATSTTDVNTTAGADLLLMFNHFIADRVEEAFFLPTSIKINCSPILYKVLSYSMLSKVYNQTSPLSIINSAFQSGNKIIGTLATKSLNGTYQSFELCPDPMLMPGTPFNPNTFDLMYMTFPSMQSELEVEDNLNDLVMLPTLIERMVLPSAPGYRDGTVRTELKRFGSIIAPVEKTVHILQGMGINQFT